MLARFVWAFLITLLALSLRGQTPPKRYQSERLPFVVETLMTGMRAPAAMVFLPDRRALVIERPTAKIHLLDLDTGAATLLTGGPEAFEGSSAELSDARRPPALTGQDSGLHDIVLHPDYAANGWIYLSYSTGTVERSTTAVDRFRLRGTALVDRQRVFTADAWSEDRYHYGGRMVFHDGHLYLTIGDRHHEDRAQELHNHTGKILRLHEDGRVPPDNPFAGQPRARPEIWCLGLRNPQGFAVHPETGELWVHEHGPLGGDEINIIRRGANYGWPVVSYGWKYSGGPIGQGITSKEGLEPPVWVWTPGIAPSGLLIYSGDAFPEWRGNFFSGAMALRHLNRIVMREGRVVVEERLMIGDAGRVRLVAQGPDGLVYIGSDDGTLRRLRPAHEPRD